LAVLSDRPQLLYNYFKQLFAQVTNPPLDAMREKLVTSLITTIGSEGNLLEETPQQCRLLRLEQPILTNAEMAKIRQLDRDHFRSHTLSTLFAKSAGAEGMRQRLEELRVEASRAIIDGATILILSDRGVSPEMVPIPALLACGGVHHHLIREESRTHCGLVVETGEAREVQHFALLTGYGAGAVNPYVAFETLAQMQADNVLPQEMSLEELEANYIKAIGLGLLKVMSKMGISTQQSYRGAQIFEAVGLEEKFVDEYFTRTPSRIQGVGLEAIAEEALRRHQHAYPPRSPKPSISTLVVSINGGVRAKRTCSIRSWSTSCKTQPDCIAAKSSIPSVARSTISSASCSRSVGCSSSSRPRSRSRSMKSSRPRRSSSALPPVRCRTARSPKKPTRHSPSP
jgi:hypothetical protein